LLDLRYRYDLWIGDNGNVTQIINYRDQTRNQMFTYDPLNRLASAQNAGTDCSVTLLGGQSKFWGNSYSYDAWGNLLQKTPRQGHCSGENLSVTVGTNNQLQSGYTYDSAGNLTHDATANLDYFYDSENRIMGAAGSIYTYDADGNRVKKASGSTGTIYWYMTPGIVAESNLAGNLTSEYIFFDGQRMARKDFPGNAVSYYFSDHLKTASVITDSAGNLKSESDYFPWGGELQFTNSDSNHYKFTGKERDTETGLDRMGVRYYGNWIGRFATPDPLMIQKQKIVDPQQWNMYQYARDNPLRFIDPTGKAVQLSNDDKERARQLAAAQSSVGKDAGKYLYDNKDKNGNHYLGVYKGGPDGKSPDFGKLNGAAGKLDSIIQDSKVATVELVSPGFFSSVGTGNGNTSIQRAGDYVTVTGATINLNSGALRPLQGNLLSSGKDEIPTLGDVFSHEMGHVYSGWFAGGSDSDGYAVRMENETRQLNSESVRLGHDHRGDVNLEHPSMEP